jgi:exodeoxyribonuclease VII large subunit
MELERLRQRLAEDGLFDVSRKRPLPTYPKVIGVVTSLQGAVWHDIQTAVQRRYPLAELLLSPAQVQGTTAEASLVVALRRLIATGRPEVIIVARGGGSVDDLSAFNGEALARAVFGSPIPIVSAIGHETDHCIMDEVADLRAPTPTAAAELVTPNMLDLARVVLQHRIDIEAAMVSTVHGARDASSTLAARVEAAHPFTRAHEDLSVARDRLSAFRRTVDELIRAGQVKADASRRLVLARRREIVERRRCEIVEPLTIRVSSSGRAAQQLRSGQVDVLQSGLVRLGPAAVLNRGYALMVGPNGRIVTRTGQLNVGDALAVHVTDGVVRSSVTGINDR